jgi:hypothetical protein
LTHQKPLQPQDLQAAWTSGSQQLTAADRYKLSLLHRPGSQGPPASVTFKDFSNDKASTKAKKAEIAKNVEHASSLPLGYFLGRWKPHGGEGLLVISEQKIISTFWRKDDDGKSEKIILEARWSNLDSDSNVEETFGLSKKQTTLAEISKRYEKAQQRYKKDPMDYAVSDPKLSRKAIQTMLPGSYPIMWSYFGGESGEEMIVDKDHMLEIKDDPYGFSVTLYNRVK